MTPDREAALESAKEKEMSCEHNENVSFNGQMIRCNDCGKQYDIVKEWLKRLQQVETDRRLERENHDQS